MIILVGGDAKKMSFFFWILASCAFSIPRVRTTSEDDSVSEFLQGSPAGSFLFSSSLYSRESDVIYELSTSQSNSDCDLEIPTSDTEYSSEAGEALRARWLVDAPHVEAKKMLVTSLKEAIEAIEDVLRHSVSLGG